MKKIIEVREFVATTGKEYEASQYPGLGLFHNTSIGGWYLVCTLSGAKTVYSLGVGATSPFPMEDYVEVERKSTEPAVTAADLLKAVAISQNPLLAKELLK